MTSGESRSKRGRGGIGKAAKECGARPARSSASRHVSLMPMSENPIFLDRQTRDKYRKQRQTYQPQTIIAPHIGNLFGSLLAHPLLKLIAFGWNCFDHRRFFAGLNKKRLLTVHLQPSSTSRGYLQSSIGASKCRCHSTKLLRSRSPISRVAMNASCLLSDCGFGAFGTGDQVAASFVHAVDTRQATSGKPATGLKCKARLLAGRLQVWISE